VFINFLSTPGGGTAPYLGLQFANKQPSVAATHGHVQPALVFVGRVVLVVLLVLPLFVLQVMLVLLALRSGLLRHDRPWAIPENGRVCPGTWRPVVCSIFC
jgi:hypothetical protein